MPGGHLCPPRVCVTRDRDPLARYCRARHRGARRAGAHAMAAQSGRYRAGDVGVAGRGPGCDRNSASSESGRGAGQPILWLAGGRSSGVSSGAATGTPQTSAPTDQRSGGGATGRAKSRHQGCPVEGRARPARGCGETILSFGGRRNQPSVSPGAWIVRRRCHIRPDRIPIGRLSTLKGAA